MRAIDKVRRALNAPVTYADLAVALVTFVGLVVSMLGLLAIGGGR